MRNYTEKTWGKCLKDLPVFTIREIEAHCYNSGKNGQEIMKTYENLNHGRKFKKEERYLSSDCIFSCSQTEVFYVKRKCKALMKKDIWFDK